jgi:hypothetical protein
MEKINSFDNGDITREEFEYLRGLDDNELSELKNKSLEKYDALEKLILTISRIEDDRNGQETLF